MFVFLFSITRALTDRCSAFSKPAVLVTSSSSCRTQARLLSVLPCWQLCRVCQWLELLRFHFLHFSAFQSLLCSMHRARVGMSTRGDWLSDTRFRYRLQISCAVGLLFTAIRRPFSSWRCFSVTPLSRTSNSTSAYSWSVLWRILIYWSSIHHIWMIAIVPTNQLIVDAVLLQATLLARRADYPRQVVVAEDPQILRCWHRTNKSSLSRILHNRRWTYSRVREYTMLTSSIALAGYRGVWLGPLPADRHLVDCNQLVFHVQLANLTRGDLWYR